ncbi:unnamed protein product [Cylicocyclus nassatus]|uniref:Histone H4 n=1 Tax=Cylicocyclus nassatus TaxID=53992 RepID=A0AA36H8J8_CYLNA|nr:unnamed protein product [Cylicocyclus nassatus]
MTPTGKGTNPSKKRPIKMIQRCVCSGITKTAIRRLARRAGVQRISEDIYEEIRCVLHLFIEEVISSAILYMEHAKRTTVTVMDVIYALKRKGYKIDEYV